MLVSIIIPVHKTPSFFKTCVQSALNQSHTNIEVILACNGELEVNQCQDFLQIEDMRLLYIKTQKGRHHARNEAMQIANGNYVQFLDYDDYLYEDKIKLQLKEQRKKESKNAISLCKWKKFNTDITEEYRFPFNHLFDKHHETLLSVIESLGREGGFIATISWLVPKNLIENIKWIDVPNDDAVFFSEMCLKDPKVVITNKVLAGYRMHEANTSTISEIRQLDLLLVGWKQIKLNLKIFNNRNAHRYIYRAYVILLKYSVNLRYYKFGKILYLIFVFGCKSNQGLLKISKDIKSSFS